MALFATRIWGFDPNAWPVMTFNSPGFRDNFLQDSEPGDQVIFVATHSEEVPVGDRGRILGKAEIGRVQVDTLQVVRMEDTQDHDWVPHGDKEGEFKWPKALLMLRAWDLEVPPLLTDIMPQLNYTATVGAVEVEEPYRTAVLGLPWRERPVPETEIRARLGRLGETLGLMRPGPRPTAGTAMVVRAADVPAWTYAMRWGNHNLWKIGWADNPADRLLDLNRHIPEKFSRDIWRVAYQQPWPTRDRAYEVEQMVHQGLRQFFVGSERFECTEAQFKQVWYKSIGM
jgi:hypothetical protein